MTYPNLILTKILINSSGNKEK